MKDPESGEIIVESDKLKEASVKYVSKLLTNRSPKEEFRKDFELMESLHELRANESSAYQVEITDVDFKDFLKQISKKKKEKNQFILKAGESYLKVLLALYPGFDLAIFARVLSKSFSNFSSSNFSSFAP